MAVGWDRAPGAESCISPDELVDRTRARAPADALITRDRIGADFVVIGHIAPHGSGVRATLTLRDAHGEPLGERSLDSRAPSCRAIDESLVLALLLLLEMSRVRAPPPKATETEPELLLPPLQEETLPQQRIRPIELPPAPSRPWRLHLGAGAVMGFGVAPKVAAGATFFGALTPPGLFPFVVQATVYPFGQDVPTAPGQGISIRRFEAGAGACPLGLVRGRFDGLLCGGARGALLVSEPLSGPLAESSSAAAVFALVLPFRAEMRAHFDHGVTLYAAASALLQPLSSRLVYSVNGEKRTAFAVPHVAAELEIGFVLPALP